MKVGKSLAISILDLSNLNPNSRIENSEFKSLSGLREILRSNIIIDCNRNRRLGSKSTSNINVDTPITSKQVMFSYYCLIFFYIHMLLEKPPFQAFFLVFKLEKENLMTRLG